MRWECSECGHRVERARPPSVCQACGTAALFVESEKTLELDPDAESLYEAWMLHATLTLGEAHDLWQQLVNV